MKHVLVLLFILGLNNCVKSQHRDSGDWCFFTRFVKCMSIDSTATGVGYFEVEKIDDKFLISSTLGHYSQDFKNFIDKTLKCVESTDIPKSSFNILVSVQNFDNSNHKARMDSLIVQEKLDTTNLIPISGSFFDKSHIRYD